MCIRDRSTNAVISLGGGTPCFGNNMEYIKSVPGITSIYLQTSIGELSRRLFAQRAKRPLIAHVNTIDALSEFIAKHVFERLSFYVQANHTIQTDGKVVSEIVNEIEGIL